ncbi:MAG: preprotein translocase subunit YajC [Actinomycetota bacterium]|jgi:preprotein translocase subunit YajC
MDSNTLSYVMYAVVILMVVFMIRNNRKQKQSRDELNSKVVKGATIMTTAGIYGTIKSVDDEKNEIVIESTPGTSLRMHRQSVASVIEKAVDEAPAAAAKKPAAKKPAAKSAK